MGLVKDRCFLDEWKYMHLVFVTLMVKLIQLTIYAKIEDQMTVWSLWYHGLSRTERARCHQHT